MPGGDDRHPRKTGSGVRAGGQSLPDEPIFRKPTYASKPHFSSFFVLQIFQRDSCYFVIVVMTKCRPNQNALSSRLVADIGLTNWNSILFGDSVLGGHREKSIRQGHAGLHARERHRGGASLIILH